MRIPFAIAIVLLATSMCLPAPAQESTSTEYFRGYGVKDANVFNAKYKERLKNWREQLELGLSRGFLQPADAERYKAWLDQLTAQDAELSGKGYPKAETDDMEQKFNAFNVDFTSAMQPKPAPSVVTTPAVPSTTPAKAPLPVAAAKKPPVPAAAMRKSPARGKATPGRTAAKKKH